MLIRQKSITSKSHNGYGSWMALVCFGLLLQVVSLISLYAQENLSLYKIDAAQYGNSLMSVQSG